MTRALILAARRSPVGRVGRAFASVREEQLLAPVISAVLADAGARPEAIDHVLIGNAAGPGGNIARVAALAAGLPASLPATSVDQQCSSALAAISLAAALVRSGAAEAVLAGGVESASTAPWRLSRPRNPRELPRVYNRARFTPEPMDDPEMGAAAEAVAKHYGVSRQRQDRFALRSHSRAHAAAVAGRFDAEIVPIRAGGSVVDADECPRPALRYAALARLAPLFADDGSVTAGNSCPINDGAAAVLVVSDAFAARTGATHALELVDAAAGAVEPDLLGMAAVPAYQRLQARLQTREPAIDIRDAAVIEFNEAFASQVLASLDELRIPDETVNRDGGAIALGHPYGASGAILTARIFSQLLRAGSPRVGTLGLALIAAAGGVGMAAAFRAVQLR